jgi:cell wall-associated NlpC family hydrolase
VPNALVPGDLAVWDGHVAMIIGDGMMIEAG